MTAQQAMTGTFSHTKRNLMIDALPLIFEGGVSNYLKPLVQSIVKHTDSRLTLELLFRLSIDRMRSQRYRQYLSENHSKKDIHRITHWPDRLIKRIWSHHYGLSRFLSNGNNSIFIASTEMVPQKGNIKVGWIVYDLTPLRIPQFFQSILRDYHGNMREHAQRTDFIVTISQNSKEDIIELLHYPADRIYVIYPGVTSRAPSQDTLPSALRPYIYYLGSLTLNKNVDGMLRIFSECVHHYGLDLDLVLTGKDFYGNRFWNQLIGELNLEGRVHITGWISSEQLENYLTHATMLWQFSWYEGFGLPVLEAASRGIPVLYSNRGALSEILNNPEQEIDPEHEEEAAEKAAQALQSPGILSRWKNIGLQRSLTFSWDTSAQLLIQHLERLS